MLWVYKRTTHSDSNHRSQATMIYTRITLVTVSQSCPDCIRTRRMLLIGTLDSISTLSRSAAGCLFTSTASHNHLPPLVTTPAMHSNTTLSTTPACTDKQVQPRRRLHSPVSGRHDAHPSPSLAPLLPPKPAPDLFGCSTQSVEPSFLRNLVVDFTQALNFINVYTISCTIEQQTNRSSSASTRS